MESEQQDLYSHYYICSQGGHLFLQYGLPLSLLFCGLSMVSYGSSDLSALL